MMMFKGKKLLSQLNLGFLKAKTRQEDQVLAISIGSHTMEGVLYSSQTHAVLRSSTQRLAQGMVTSSGDVVSDAALLAEAINRVYVELRPSTRHFHLSIPCTLLRVVELPKMEDEEYYLSLASEAERFRAFDNTEAIVQFKRLPNASSPLNQRMVYTAVRKDTFTQYLKAVQITRLQLDSLSVEPLNIMHTLAGTALIEEIQARKTEGLPPVCWGTMMHDFDRLRFMVWQGQDLIDIREITMSGQLLSSTEQNDVILDDLVTELRRTITTVKPLVPEFWYTHRLSFVLLQHLQHRLGATFRSFQIPSHIPVDRADIELSGLGCAIGGGQDSPYTLNLLDTKSPYQLEAAWKDMFSLAALRGQSMRFSTQALENTSLARFLIPACVGSTGLVVVVWVFLLLANLILKSQQQEALVSQQQAATNVERLNTQLEFHKENYMLSQKILSVAEASTEVNELLIGLLEDIQHIPSSLWISEVGYDEQVTITGYASDHSDIIEAARGFESRPYGSQFVLHYITEAVVGVNSPSVYSFMLGGLLNTSARSPFEAVTGPETTNGTLEPETSGTPSGQQTSSEAVTSTVSGPSNAQPYPPVKAGTSAQGPVASNPPSASTAGGPPL
jgi:hypothetical protein